MGIERLAEVGIMRKIFLYDPRNSRVVEEYDLSHSSVTDCEMLKIQLLLRCPFPYEVIDTAGHEIPCRCNDASFRNSLMGRTTVAAKTPGSGLIDDGLQPSSPVSQHSGGSMVASNMC